MRRFLAINDQGDAELVWLTVTSASGSHEEKLTPTETLELVEDLMSALLDATRPLREERERPYTFGEHAAAMGSLRSALGAWLKIHGAPEMKLTTPLKYEHRAVVTGKCPFPIDMLRYDNCMPATEEGAGAIRRSIEDQGTNEVFEVEIMRYGDIRQPCGSRTAGASSR